MKKTIKIIFLVVIVVIIGASGFFLYDAIPPKITGVKAQFGAVDGSLIVVEYYTDKPLKTDILSDKAYIIVEPTNEVLPVKGVPKIGPMISRSAGKTVGWFIIDNGFNQVTNTTPITIVIGNYRLENYTISTTA